MVTGGENLLLFVRPADDAGAAMLAGWAELIQSRFAEGFDDLSGGMVTRSALEAHLEQRPRALTWFGHGTRDALTVAGVAVLDAENIGSLSGRPIVAIACMSADQLGPVGESLGIAGYLGFRRLLGWSSLNPEPTGLALVEGLGCLFALGHDLDCARANLKARFEIVATRFYEQAMTEGMETQAGGLSDAALGYYAALGNLDGLAVVGDGSTVL